ncbi:MAG: hypothetical protein GC201_12065 [Alphaproteobacteria bacterium]|nr:hypothetical protein [Alphaproteobacteria bacterium]
MPDGDDEASLLDAIYRIATDDSALAQVLAALGDRYGCDGAAFLYSDLQDNRSQILLCHGAWGGDVFERYREVAEFDPAPRAFALLPKQMVSTTDQLFSPDFKAASFFWNEFYRPAGFTETVGATLFADGGRHAVLGLHRSDARPVFAEADIADLQRLVAHLVRAFQMRRQFRDVAARAVTFEAVIGRLEAGVLLLDSGGRLTFANGAGRAVLDRGDGIGLGRAGNLVVAQPQARSRLAALIADVGAGGAGGVVSVPRSGGRSGYPLLVAPAPSAAGGIADPRDSPRPAMLFIHDPERQLRDAAAVLQQALGLTPGAARLVEALTRDGDLKSFAESNGVTIHTARFHLRAALERTQTRSQAEIVRLAVRVLRDLALGGG